MKLSIAWIFDHIDANWKKIDINELVQNFNYKTAEIEHVTKIKTDLSNLTLAQVSEIKDNSILLFSQELKKTLELPFRSDAKLEHWYLVKKDGLDYVWATSLDFASQKEYILPSFNCSENLQSGGWKKDFETEDYIIEISSVAITNRPDLWCHRGVAREFAIFLNKNLKKQDDFLEEISLVETSKDFLKDGKFEIQIKDSSKCKRLSILNVQEIQNVPSQLFMASRLARIDSKAINTIVDATNYTMFDIGQPMHAFDASKIDKIFMAKDANNGEKLMLLDGQEVELTKDDCVIATEDRVLSLAGIMGGKDSSVNENAKSVVLEAGCFDASAIRKTSTRLKVRSESSIRYEKSLDPNQNTLAIRRFVKLFKDTGLKIKYDGPIFSIGAKEVEKKIIVEHDFIESRLGISIDSSAVLDILKSLGFDAYLDEVTYTVSVPSRRSTKDVTLPEDIVEEIIRLYGFQKIPFILPSKVTEPHSIDAVLRLRAIKKFMAYSAGMTELNNYPFYDESFIKQINYEPEGIEVISPVSQNWKKLVSSLMPQLFKAIEINLHRADRMRFFEINRIWSKENETKSLAGIVFDYKGETDFYIEKSYINSLLLMLGINAEWQKSADVEPWFDESMTADIIFENKVLGRAGMVKSEFLKKLTDLGNAFVFELDAEFLVNYNPKTIKYEPISKYPTNNLDVSLFVPLDITFDEIENKIYKVDNLIKKVQLIDLFQKSDWADKKSMTLRYTIVDDTKTLTKEDLDNIMQKVNAAVTSLGAQVR